MKMEFEIKSFEGLKYIIRYPSDYKSKEKYPLLFFIHGAGSRGDDINFLKNNPFFKITGEYEDFPFITAAPQCGADTWFDLFESLKKFVLYISGLDFCDRSRVYAMGTSMGGYAVWQLAMSMPETFAAIVPICGGGMYWNAARLVGVKVWAFHGKDDKAVFARESLEMVKRINDAGGSALCTVYENTAHDSWTKTYSNEKVFRWLLDNKKDKSDRRSESGIINDPVIYG